jgi:hypothetical protein
VAANDLAAMRTPAFGRLGRGRDGPAHLIVSTDSGLVGSRNHADALVHAAQTLRAAGFSEADLDLMFKANPARVLGLRWAPTALGRHAIDSIHGSHPVST